MSRLVLPFALVASLLLAGCATHDDTADHLAAESAALNATASAMNNMSQAQANMSHAQANASASGKDPNMPDDPSSCMPGMDMPGCTEAQAAYAYKKYQEEQAAKGPPPDRALTPVKIALNPQGAGQKASPNVDEKTMSLIATIFVNSTGTGPYAATGSSPTSDLVLTFKGPTTTKSVTLSGTAASVGVEPATPLAKKFSLTLPMPESGVWTLSVDGQGQDVQVEVDLLERFTMDP